jgi:hypothetical protein
MGAALPPVSLCVDAPKDALGKLGHIQFFNFIAIGAENVPQYLAANILAALRVPKVHEHPPVAGPVQFNL